MRNWIGPALLASLALLFFIANHGAYRGFFQGDELDSLGWAPQIPAGDFAKDLVNPVYNARNFRPVGHLFFRIMGRTFGLDFRKYLPPLHLLHLLNVWLFWLVLRNLGASPFAAGAGALFFAFEMAVFDVYWKPMYAFDLFCAAFSLASILAWIKRRWLLSFAAFWMAYKSKELAVMLPAVLACYEWWFGKRQWKPLVPFFVVSLSFGLQGIAFNPNENNAYAFSFTPAALASSARFYASALFGIPLAGFALLILPLVWRDRLMWLGIAGAALFFVPLVFLPGRLFSAYWYLPLIGVAMAVASLAGGRYGWLAAIFLAGWIPWNYAALRDYRDRTLAEDAGVRAYVTQLEAAVPSFKDVNLFLYHGLPPSLQPWGASGALRYLLPGRTIKMISVTDPAAKALLRFPWLATLTWVDRSRHLWVAVRTVNTLDTTYITMNEVTPVWQLGDGWYGPEDTYRWTALRATAHLYRAARATQFEVVVYVAPSQLAKTGGHSDLTARLNGVLLGSTRLSEPGIRIVRWPLPPGPPGTVEVHFQADPEFHVRQGDGRPLGAAIMSFGFLPSGR